MDQKDDDYYNDALAEDEILDELFPEDTADRETAAAVRLARQSRLLNEACEAMIEAFDGVVCVAIPIGFAVELERAYFIGDGLRGLRAPEDPIERRDIDTTSEVVYVFPRAGRAVLDGCNLPTIVHLN